MAKYRNQRFVEEEKKTDELTEQFKEEAKIQNEPAPNKEEETFKKRYSDLRRHMAEKEAEWDRKFKSLEAAASNKMQLPKSEEELEAWKRNYPDVAAIIDTMIQKRVSDGVAQANERFSEFDKLKQELTFKEAMMKLQEAHPDFDKIRQDPKFLEWVEEQREEGRDWVFDALFNNSSDWKAAAKAITFYKDTNSLKDEKKEKTEKKDKSAAESVRVSGERQREFKSSDFDFSETQIERMSGVEYEKYEEKIKEAMRNGRVLMDKSGAAR